MHDPIEIIRTITDYIPYVLERKKELKDAIDEADKRQTDLLHEIENNNFSASEGYCKAKELQELRRQRRKLKNEYAVLEPLYTYLNNNKKLEIDLFKVRTTMQRIKEGKDNWIYTPRLQEGGINADGLCEGSD